MVDHVRELGLCQGLRGAGDQHHRRHRHHALNASHVVLLRNSTPGALAARWRRVGNYTEQDGGSCDAQDIGDLAEACSRQGAFPAFTPEA